MVDAGNETRSLSANCSISKEDIPPWQHTPAHLQAHRIWYRVAFVTIVRDTCVGLPILRCQLDLLRTRLPKSSIFVVEDNSDDCSQDFLRKWSKEDSTVHVMSFSDATPAAAVHGRINVYRFARLADLRNTAIDLTLDWSPDVVVMFDSDLTRGFTNWAIWRAITAAGRREYSAMCANDVIPTENFRYYYNSLKTNI